MKPTSLNSNASVRGLRDLGVFLVMLLLVAPACGDDIPTTVGSEGVDVLFIGNSLTYTNDLPAMLRAMLVDAGVEVGRMESVAEPNYGLEDHWVMGPARDRIAAGGWDVVVMQQGPSATEGRPSLLDYSKRFADEIRAAGGRPAMYMVWPSLSRFFDFDGVSDSYRTAAQQADALLYPSGEAWRAAWAKDTDLDLYGVDGFHPSQLGTYVAALVMFEQLSGKDPRELPASIPGPLGDVDLSAEVAKMVQEAAMEANQQFARN